MIFRKRKEHTCPRLYNESLRSYVDRVIKSKDSDLINTTLKVYRRRERGVDMVKYLDKRGVEWVFESMGSNMIIVWKDGE